MRKFALFLTLSLCLFQATQAGNVRVRVQDGTGRSLTDAVVFLESAAAKSLVKSASGSEIAQVGKQFVPSVTVVPVGSLVQFPNRDTVRHHVYSFSPAKTFELKLYTGTAASPVLFDRPGIVVLGCNIHDHMTAWVVVVETPYFGKSTEAGEVTLANVAPGSYKLRAWHTSLPVGAAALEQSLTVGATDTAVVVVDLKGAKP
jgi:plastocyanin